MDSMAIMAKLLRLGKLQKKQKNYYGLLRKVYMLGFGNLGQEIELVMLVLPFKTIPKNMGTG